MDRHGTGFPWAQEGETWSPKLLGIPALWGKKITSVALSILCNVSCRQN